MGHGQLLQQDNKRIFDVLFTRVVSSGITKNHVFWKRSRKTFLWANWTKKLPDARWKNENLSCKEIKRKFQDLETVFVLNTSQAISMAKKEHEDFTYFATYVNQLESQGLQEMKHDEIKRKMYVAGL